MLHPSDAGDKEGVVHTYKLNTHVLFRRQNETATLFNPTNGKIFSVNVGGASILEMLMMPHSVVDIEQQLQEQFTFNDADVARQDIAQFLEEMVALGLVEV